MTKMTGKKFDPSTHEEIEVCLGCGKPTVEYDCGCPAGTGFVVRRQFRTRERVDNSLQQKPPEPPA